MLRHQILSNWMLAIFTSAVVVGAVAPALAANSVSAPALISNGGTLHSFADAINLPLVTDADFGRFIDPQVTGANRRLAISLLRFMPANKRGDFVYVTPSRSVLSNRLAVGFSVRFMPKPFFLGRPSTNLMRHTKFRSLAVAKPAGYPPTGGTGGAFIRTYSVQNINAAYGYVNPPCDYGMQAGESGNMYFNAYDSNGSDLTDAGIGTGQNAATRNSDGTPNGLSVSFVNFSGNQYWNSGWTNQSQLYACDSPVGIMYGTVPFLIVNGYMTSILATGTPDYDPSQLALPPSSTTWTSGAWTFWPTRSGLTVGPTTWNGVPSPCSGCSIGRMITIGQNGGLNYDGSCYGYCTSAGADAFWYETVAGQIVPSCQQVQGVSETCTILGASSWVGGEVDSGQGIAYSPLNDQYAAGGIDLTPFNNTSSRARALNYPLPNSPASSCPPDAHGYCSALYVSGYDSNMCPTNGPKGPHYLYGRVTEYFVFSSKAPSKLREIAVKTQDWINEGDGICSPTTTWSPGEPKLQYNDPSLP